MRLLHLQLKMPVGRYVGTIVWARKVYDDIYELSFLLDIGGYQLWFAQALEAGGFNLISCSMYESVETLAIKLKEETLKEATTCE